MFRNVFIHIACDSLEHLRNCNNSQFEAQSLDIAVSFLQSELLFSMCEATVNKSPSISIQS